jgi:2-amino-4-ketopentanoate thiolase alpha subunit
MTERATKHTWVEVQVKGFLTHEATLGEEAEIITPAGRILTGTLTAIQPAYTHLYGPPVPELLSIGGEVRAILSTRGKAP